MVREIPLTQGLVALVDDEDFERVNRHNWSVLTTGRSKAHKYARRVVTVDGRQFSILLHRFLMGVPDGLHIDHIDGDGLNNQKSNLRFASARQNQWNTVAKGVAKSGRLFYAFINHGDKHFRGPGMESEAEATALRNALARKLRGEFARVATDTDASHIAELADRIIAGEKFPRRPSKSRRLLTNEQVTEIRQRYAAGGVRQCDLAVEYGVKTAAISHVITGRTFSEIGGETSHRKQRDTENYRDHCRRARRKLTDAQIVDMRTRYATGTVSQAQLAADFGVSPGTVQHIIQGRSFSEVGGPVRGYSQGVNAS